MCRAAGSGPYSSRSVEAPMKGNVIGPDDEKRYEKITFYIDNSSKVHHRFLTLHVRKEYFDQIKSGEKTEEYRQIKPYWYRRLSGPPGGSVTYDYVVIMHGYPSKDETGKRLYFRYNGYRVKTTCHKEFGKDPVKVFAIILDPKLRRDNPDLSA